MKIKLVKLEEIEVDLPDIVVLAAQTRKQWDLKNDALVSMQDILHVAMQEGVIEELGTHEIHWDFQDPVEWREELAPVDISDLAEEDAA